MKRKSWPRRRPHLWSQRVVLEPISSGGVAGKEELGVAAARICYRLELSWSGQREVLFLFF
jgi:hypothetical protein